MPCTGSRHLPTPTESGFTCSRLAGFDIDYIWLTKSAANQSGQTNITASMNPFSRQLSLPFLAVINDAVQRLVTFQLVRSEISFLDHMPTDQYDRRYPFIFGSWCKVVNGGSKSAFVMIFIFIAIRCRAAILWFNLCIYFPYSGSLS